MSTFLRSPAIRRAVVAGTAAVALGAGGFGLGGCGLTAKPTPSALPQATESPSAGTAANNFPDVCNLFTTAEMSALTKQTIVVASPDGKSTKESPSCDWNKADTAIVTVITLATKQKSDFDSEKGSYEPVPGLGDGAYENHGILTVLHGTIEISVIFGGSGEESVAVQKLIAQKVIEKLDNPASPSPSAS